MLRTDDQILCRVAHPIREQDQTATAAAFDLHAFAHKKFDEDALLQQVRLQRLRMEPGSST